MVIVDTSVWINHFNQNDINLECLLENGEVILHPFIIGELACGNMKNRQLILSLLKTLPLVKPVNQNEFFHFVNEHKIYGTGLGFVDIHILAASYLNNNNIYTCDKKLAALARKLNLLFSQ